MNKLLAPMLLAVCGFAAAADAEIVSGTITADNHYALYSSAGDVFSYHGGNEVGAGGAPGQYNWSVAESYEFEAGDFIYIAAWSDDSVAQGVLAQFSSSSLGTILSGDIRWQVYGTNINRGDGDPHPDAAEIGAHVGVADANNLWETPYVGGLNGVQPWDTIAGVPDEACWMWMDIADDADPLNGGSGAAEMLIFRTPVPAPSTAALLVFGAFGARRRRR